MNLTYEVLIGVSFQHSYFMNESPRCFDVKVSAETETVLLNNGLLFKPKSNGFIIGFESYNNGKERRREAVLASDRLLRFTVRMHDPLFYNYTSLSTPDISNSIFLFNNVFGSKESRLHPGEYVELTDIISVKNIKENYFTKPFAIIEIYLEKVDTKEYVIRFKEKYTYWRYLLVSDHLKELNNPAVINDSVIFNGPEKIILPDKRTALAFESTIPIGIKERSERAFQLVENYDAVTKKGKTITKALPHPDVNLISKINNNEQKEYSEIIIH